MTDAAVIVGSPRAVTIHGREFPVDAYCGALLNLGGVENTVEVFGSGNAGILQRMIPWHVVGLDVVISEDRGDLGFLAEVFNAIVAPISGIIPGVSLGIKPPPTGPDRGYLADIAELGSFVPMTFELVDGTIYGGSGTIVGPIAGELMSGFAKLDFQGQGRLRKQ